MKLAQERHIDAKCRAFFGKLQDVNPQSRMNKAYKFIRRYKRQKSQTKNTARIPMTSWETELRRYCNDAPPPLITRMDDHHPPAPPPTTAQISDILDKMKNSTAPGTDQINVELLKYGPAELIELMQVILGKEWNDNEIPDEWTHTAQVPIPKTRGPKEVDDYRRITLCNTIYKVYAKFMLDRMESYVGDIPLYQAGFLRNRSMDDHIFTIRRVTEERRRKGLRTYLLSVDLREAFDNVDLSVVADILRRYGVPVFLINRIIKATLYERTCVQWFGRRTDQYVKSRGVKQGCPLSPFLFIVVLHYALDRVATRMGIDLNYREILLPMLLAYADDILIMAESENMMETVLRELIPELQTIGLQINEKKCAVLIRDPLDTSVTQPDHLLLNGTKYDVVPVMKYLGIYLTRDLDRRNTVVARIKAAYRAFYMLVPFVMENRLKWDTLVMMYHALVVPIALYGLKVATLIQQNRRSLERMEATIVKRMREIARHPPATTNVHSLLNGKTIIQKSRVGRLKYWVHVARRPRTHMLQRAMRFRYQGKRKIGRPCHTWNETLQKDIQTTGVDDWEDTIEDRQQHEAKCEGVFLVAGTRP